MDPFPPSSRQPPNATCAWTAFRRPDQGASRTAHVTRSRGVVGGRRAHLQRGQQGRPLLDHPHGHGRSRPASAWRPARGRRDPRCRKTAGLVLAGPSPSLAPGSRGGSPVCTYEFDAATDREMCAKEQPLREASGGVRQAGEGERGPGVAEGRFEGRRVSGLRLCGELPATVQPSCWPTSSPPPTRWVC